MFIKFIEEQIKRFMVKKIKGTHDLFHDEMSKWQFIEKKLKTLFETYNFQEIRTPIIEYKEVFYRATEKSDIVKKETYQFHDKKGRLIALRPEGTASVIRSYIENKLDHQNELTKLYYLGPFFRYERPQKGRYRQFHQIGVEAIGVPNSLSEVEVIILAYESLLTLGLKNVKIKINTLGDLPTRQNFLTIFKNYIDQNTQNLCSLCLERKEKNVLRIFDCKQCSQKDVLKKAPLILDHLSVEAKNKFDHVLELLKEARVNYEIDHLLVRGLDYYTDTVFEITNNDDANQNDLVLGGGGNYNELTEVFGGKKTHCIGFALGIERLMIVMEENHLFPDVSSSVLDVYLLALDRDALKPAFMLMQKIRQHGLQTNMNYETGHFNKKLKKALQTNPKYLLFIGEKELKDNVLTVKNIAEKKEYKLSPEQTINFLIKELTSENKI
nr:histidine--tRNA ligase [Milkweed yellows phytoplasma]